MFSPRNAKRVSKNSHEQLQPKTYRKPSTLKFYSCKEKRYTHTTIAMPTTTTTTTATTKSNRERKRNTCHPFGIRHVPNDVVWKRNGNYLWWKFKWNRAKWACVSTCAKWAKYIQFICVLLFFLFCFPLKPCYVFVLLSPPLLSSLSTTLARRRYSIACIELIPC